MLWVDLIDLWMSKGKVCPKDLKKIDIFERLELANFWGMKCNIFNVTKKLAKEIASRERMRREIRKKIEEMKLRCQNER